MNRAYACIFCLSNGIGSSQPGCKFLSPAGKYLFYVVLDICVRVMLSRILDLIPAGNLSDGEKKEIEKTRKAESCSSVAVVLPFKSSAAQGAGS